jgi:hypothetical protein
MLRPKNVGNPFELLKKAPLKKRPKENRVP